MLGLRYDNPAGRALAGRIMETVCHSAYRASVDLARERGPFHFFASGPYLDGPFVRRLPEDISAGIRAHGIRSGHRPSRNLSLYANGVSSGLEPFFVFEHRRRIRDRTGECAWHKVTDYALRHVQAYRLGLKGCTAFRPNPITGSALTGNDETNDPGEPAVGCCGLDRHDE